MPSRNPHPLRELIDAVRGSATHGAHYYLEIQPSCFQSGDFSVDNWSRLSDYVGECLRAWRAADDADVFLVRFASRPRADRDVPVEAIAAFKVTTKDVVTIPPAELMAFRDGNLGPSKWSLFEPTSPEGWIDGFEMLPPGGPTASTPRPPDATRKGSLPPLPPGRRTRANRRR